MLLFNWIHQFPDQDFDLLKDRHKSDGFGNLNVFHIFVAIFYFFNNLYLIHLVKQQMTVISGQTTNFVAVAIIKLQHKFYIENWNDEVRSIKVAKSILLTTSRSISSLQNTLLYKSTQMLNVILAFIQRESLLSK